MNFNKNINNINTNINPNTNAQGKVNTNYDSRNSATNRLFEETKFFGVSKKNASRSAIGEITGESISFSREMSGMPIRTQYMSKKSTKGLEQSNRNDFDMIEDNLPLQNRNNAEVGYFDPHTDPHFGNQSTFTDIRDTDKLLSNEIRSDNNMFNKISNWTLMLFNHFLHSYDSSYFIGFINLYIAMAWLYINSDKNVHMELQNLFNFPSNKDLIADLNLLNNKFINGNVKIQNMLIYDNSHVVDQQQAVKLNAFMSVIPIDRSNYKQETHRINSIVQKKTNLQNIISATTVKSIINTIISVVNIDLVWEWKIASVINSQFGNKIIPFLFFKNIPVQMYEDDNITCIDIQCNNNMFFGLIKNRVDDGTASFDVSDVLSYISNLKSVVINELYIPLFTKLFKYRLKLMFNKLGINTTFMDTELNHLFTNSADNYDNLDDIIQYTHLNITNISKGKVYNGKSIKRKIAYNDPFHFYLRLQNKCIIFMGTLVD